MSSIEFPISKYRRYAPKQLSRLLYIPVKVSQEIFRIGCDE
jgi:hypothetical protein